MFKDFRQSFSIQNLAILILVCVTLSPNIVQSQRIKNGPGFATKSALNDLTAEVTALKLLVSQLQDRLEILEEEAAAGKNKMTAPVRPSSLPSFGGTKKVQSVVTTTTPTPSTTEPPQTIKKVDSVTKSKVPVLQPNMTEYVSFGKGEIFPARGWPERVELNIETDTRIVLYAVGFYGPIHSDAYFDVKSFVIKKYSDGKWAEVYSMTPRRVFGRQGDITYVDLDEPFILEPSQNNNKYLVESGIEGPDTPSNPARPSSWLNFSEAGVNFKISHYPVTPFAELEFAKMV